MMFSRENNFISLFPCATFRVKTLRETTETTMNLAKAYTPNDYEPTIYALWEQSGVFAPKGEGAPYAIVMPPPNANGNLHVGHALSFDLEDLLVRFHRLKGYDAVLLPGADHAGFETWVVYERELEK
jgi:valyl-tRNA synthetase